MQTKSIFNYKHTQINCLCAAAITTSSRRRAASYSTYDPLALALDGRAPPRLRHRFLFHWSLHDLNNMQRYIDRVKYCLKNIIIYSSNIIFLFDNAINDDILLWLLSVVGTVEVEAMMSVSSHL